MYNTTISGAIRSRRIFETGSRIAETFTLFIKLVFNKKRERNEAFSYFPGLIQKGSTIIDIGAHNNHYLYFLLKMEKCAAKLISFETDSETYRHLSLKKETLRLKNVVVEKLSFSKETEKVLPAFSLQRRNGATVIDFKTGKSQYTRHAVPAGMLDKYCEVYDIEPDFLFISCKGDELTVLNGAAEVLKKYKPKFLLECHERLAGRKKVLQTFEFLRTLKYSGYFILDTIKIPVINFDFNIYQNPLSDFYCKDFIFE